MRTAHKTTRTVYRMVATGCAAWLAAALMSAATAQNSQNCDADKITLTNSPHAVLLFGGIPVGGQPVPGTKVNFTVHEQRTCILVEFSASIKVHPTGNRNFSIITLRALLDDKIASNRVSWTVVTGRPDSRSHQFFFDGANAGSHTIYMQFVRQEGTADMEMSDRITTVHH